MAFAKNTSVAVEKSEAELKTLIVRKSGGTNYVSGQIGQRVAIEFTLRARRLRFGFVLPDRQKFLKNPRGGLRNPQQLIDALAQEERRLWRCLLLAVKSKLETVASGIFSFDDEFLSQIVDPETNLTMAEKIKPAMLASYNGDTGQKLLAGPSA